MDTASYSQSPANSWTASISRAGVSFLPEVALRGSVWPVARILNLVPPMSMTRIFVGASSGFIDWGGLLFVVGFAAAVFVFMGGPWAVPLAVIRYADLPAHRQHRARRTLRPDSRTDVFAERD